MVKNARRSLNILLLERYESNTIMNGLIFILKSNFYFTKNRWKVILVVEINNIRFRCQQQFILNDG